ncbi:MAG TPA: hypothetical protein VJA47_00995, partial [archaeon]|nr:hypothetical protein [archaeon]
YGLLEETLENLKSKEWVVKMATPTEPARNDYKVDGKMDVLAPFKDLVGKLAQAHDLKNGFELTVSSEIPKDSGGMSSSTAFLSSVLGALNHEFELGIEHNNFFDVLLPYQVKIHGGAASGAEITSSSMGGYNWVKRDLTKTPPVLERKNLGKQDFSLVIGNTKVVGLTSETVPYVRSGFNGDNSSYNEVFDKITKLVADAEKAIKSGDAKLLGALMDEDHELLARDLGVSHPKLNKLVDAARKAGAYGAKMSGGGKGGVMVALVSKDSEERVSKAIAAAGGHPYVTSVGGHGVQLH